MSAAWSPPPAADLTGPQRIDIYMVWDSLTAQARHRIDPITGTPRAGTHWPVMVEFADRRSGLQMDRWCALQAVEAEQAALRAAFAPSLARAPTSAIHTALLPFKMEPLLLAGVNAGVLERFQLGAPCAYQAPPAQAPAAGNRLGTSPALHTLGVIDDGCCFAHHDFRGAGAGCRVHALWDQSPAATAIKGWSALSAQGAATPYRYGVELLQAELNTLLRERPQLGEAAERALYDGIGRPRWGRPTRTHGARVMHLLAGKAGQGDVKGKGPKAHDATTMPIVFVQLPDQTVGDVTGDSLGMHVVDGARYIVEHAKALAGGAAGWSATINVSLGSIAGPHDGTSMAEQALAELAARPRVTLVMAAGNTAGDRERIHAQQTVRKGRDGSFVVRVPPANRRDGFVELWFDTSVAGADYAVTVTAPGGQRTEVALRAGNAAVLAEPGGAPQAALVFANKVAQGLNDTMALLAIAPTAKWPGDDRTLAAAGSWVLTVSSQSDTAAEVHAWIERDDTVIGARRGQQLRFEKPSHNAADPSVNDDVTLSNLANAPGLKTVGGYVETAQKVAEYSANGPLRTERRQGVGASQPSHFAPSDRSFWLPGMPVPGFYSGTHASISGTSGAAPQVARALAEERSIDALAGPVGARERPPRMARKGGAAPLGAGWLRRRRTP